MRGYRVPLRYQLTATECGAACLAMVLSHHGRTTPVSECRDALGLGRDGVSAERLVEAAARYGVRAHLDECEDPLAEPSTGPSIVYLAKRHFVVLEWVGRRHLRIADPAGGRQLLTHEELRERYGGVVVRLDPGSDFERRRLPIRDTLLARYLREFVAVPGGRRLLVGLFLGAIALQAVGLALPFGTRFAVDHVLPLRRDDLLPALGVCILGIVLLHGLLVFGRSRLLLALRASGDQFLTRRFVDHLLRLPVTFFLQRSRGDLLMRLSGVSMTREMLTQQVLTLMLDAILLTGYVVGLAVLAPQHIVVVLAIGTTQAAVLATSYRRIRGLARRELQAKAEEQSYLVETLEAVVPVKANGVEHTVLARWAELFGAYRMAMVRRGKASSWVEAVQGGLSTLAPLALLWFGLSLVLQGRMSLGTMLAANVLSMSVLSPLQAFIGAIQMFSVLRAQIERIYDVLDAQPERSGTVVLPRRSPATVSASGVSFRYDGQGAPVVRDVSFSLPPGGKLGVVGRTGSGKSTLAMLVLGLLRADRGTVAVDGIPIDRLDVVELRRGCGAVLQQLTLFNGSIRENLVLGRPGITDAEVTAAALTAGLHADVLVLPMRYDTIVGEAGAALSAGQRQRVALARALLHRPRLLVLDEATSHLDPQTERWVDDALGQLKVSRIVISHRLSAIRNADQILVLDQGRIVARGRHEDLVTTGGIYRDLFGPSLNGSAPHAGVPDRGRRTDDPY